jgi:DNA adenine methylase
MNQGDLFAPGLARRTRLDIEPPFRWVGAKRWLCQQHGYLLPSPSSCSRIVVPFVGGGSIAFYYAGLGAQEKLRLSDALPPLIDVYLALRDMPEVLLGLLHGIEEKGYSRQHFEQVRHQYNATRETATVSMRAALFIAILSWGMNGLWRTNRKGECNTPFGKPAGDGPLRFPSEERLRACSRALQGVPIECRDFEAHVIDAKPTIGDFFYFDMPYVPASATSAFTGYTQDGFSADDQARLVALLLRLDKAGARWALSNSDTSVTRQMYAYPNWNVTALQRSGSISSKTDGRQAVGEILVRNYRENDR